jgi:probable DNA repair protein
LRLPQQVLAFLAEFTPAQRRFLDAMAEAGVTVTCAPEPDATEYSTLHEEGTTAAPLRREFDGVSDELLAAAHWARQQLESTPEAHIGILLFDLDRKLPQVESAFRCVLHPEHLLGQRTPAAFEIASPRALADYPIIRCALQLLAFFAAPIDFYSFHAMLNSPYLAGAPESVARFLAAVRPHARRQVGFDDLARWLRESSHGPTDVPELRAALSRIPSHAAFSSQQPAGYWAKISREILLAFGWPGGSASGFVQNVTLGSEEFQCTQSWGELFSAIASLELLERRTDLRGTDFRSFVARLERAAATRNFKPETLNAPIQIMDLAESDGSLFDALWIAGCSDDRWPDSPRCSPLIPVALLKAAGVAVEGTPQAEVRIARITSRLLQSAPQLSLSLALRGDDEREQRWSPLFAEFPLASEPIDLLPPLAARFAPVALEAIPDAKAPALATGESPRGGTSLLQEQSNCPFRAFAIRRLLTRQDEGPNEALAPTERGNILDRALQLIWEELHDSQGLQRPDCPAILAASVDAAMASELPPTADSWTLRFRAIERQRTIGVLTEWLAVEAERKPFHVLAHQQKVDVTLGGLSLHGCLDRLDEIGDDGAHVVIDYKSGAANTVSAWRVPRPRLPQLPFYAFAMLQQKLNLAGISFATVRRGECGFKGYLRAPDLLPCADPTKRSFDGVPFDEYAGRWATELERIAISFVQGDAAVDPIIPPGKSGSPCEHCHLTSLCRIGDESAGEPDE